MGGLATKANPVIMGSVKELITLKLSQKKVLVISKSACPFCTRAKDILKKYGLKPEDYEVIEIDNRSDCDEIQDYMKEITGARSVPRVFIGGKCIGGGDDTVALDSNGQLEVMLKECGAL